MYRLRDTLPLRWLRGLFRLRWEYRNMDGWLRCQACGGIGIVNLREERLRAFDANVVNCRVCRGHGAIPITKENAPPVPWAGNNVFTHTWRHRRRR